MRQLGNFRAHRRDVGNLLFTAIGFEERRKDVGGSQGDVGNEWSGRGICKREYIFKFMSEFAQLPEPASGGVPLERVDGSPQATHDFGVARRLLQKHRLL